MSVSDKLLIQDGGKFVMEAFLTMDNDDNGSLFEIEDNGTFEYSNTNSSPRFFFRKPRISILILILSLIIGIMELTLFIRQASISREITARTYFDDTEHTRHCLEIYIIKIIQVVLLD